MSEGRSKRESEDQRKRGKEEERDLWRGSEGEREKQSQSVCQTDKQTDGGGCLKLFWSSESKSAPS